MSASETPYVTPENLQNLREEAKNSAAQCEAIALEAQEKNTLLEETREIVRNLAIRFKYLNKLPKKHTRQDKEDALNHIHDLVLNLVDKKDELNNRKKDFKAIQSKLALAFKLAQHNQHLLSQAQRKLVEMRVEAKQRVKVDLEAIPMPPKDSKALHFYENLQERGKRDFDKVNRMIFHKSFAKQHGAIKRRVQSVEKPYFPKRLEMLIFSDKEKIESLIASRIAKLALEHNVFVIDQNAYKMLRAAALQQLEDEQVIVIREQEVREQEIREQQIREQEIKDQETREKQIQEEEIRKRKINDEEIQRQRKVQQKVPSKLKLNLRTTIAKRIESGNVDCQKLLDDFYKELKTKHLNQADCKKIFNQVTANLSKQPLNQNFTNSVHKSLVMQLQNILRNYKF